jgi:2-keto-4-pentenoate hydratase/2-oxohepta-3-ene-1,7-dioic acid hydratase in catechol pathway
MKIICIGRNYAEHIRELNNEIPDEPVIFIKPDSALLRNNAPFFIPEFSNDVHYEVELVIKINKLGKHIPIQFARDYYSEIALGIDFTARDLQSKLKEKGLPWEKAKGFDHSAVISKFIPVEQFGISQNDSIKSLNFSLQKNNVVVQQGNTDFMINNIEEIISHVSQYFTLKIGDYIFTGTPAGVGPVAPGDHLTGFIESTEMFSFQIY